MLFSQLQSNLEAIASKLLIGGDTYHYSIDKYPEI